MNPVMNSLKQAAIDWRLVMMGTVLAAIALVFNILSGGLFLSPENLYNIAQQTAVVGVVATVVVLVIVARHIDLSVGSVLALAASAVAAAFSVQSSARSVGAAPVRLSRLLLRPPATTATSCHKNDDTVRVNLPHRFGAGGVFFSPNKKDLKAFTSGLFYKLRITS